MRRIVTVTTNARSRVMSDEPVAPSTTPITELWETSPACPLGAEPPGHERPLDVAPQVSAARVVEVPPNAGVDGGGWHTTDTIDYVIPLDAGLDLVLDDGAVTVAPGDLIVQRGTRHAWRNASDRPVHLIAVMIGLP